MQRWPVAVGGDWPGGFVVVTNPIQFIHSDNTISTGTSTGNKDHPKFTKLRDKLEQNGYISTERRYWNGDRVLVNFSLNGLLFKKGDQFPCATAMNVRLKNKS